MEPKPGQQYREKTLRLETKALEHGLIEAVVSTEAKDRHGDIIRVAGWDLTNFLLHPVLIANHNYNDPLFQIGVWKSMEVNTRRKQLVGVASYNLGANNPIAEYAYWLAEHGQAAFSVGFIPDMSKAKELEDEGRHFMPSFEFNGQEMLETSQVTIPANHEAVQRMKGLLEHDMLGAWVDQFNQRLGQVEAGLKENPVSPPAMPRDLPGELAEAIRRAF